MVRVLGSLVFLFFIFTSISLAVNIEPKLKKEFGDELTHAQFFLRYAFYKKYHKDWKDSDYYERKVFLTDYVKNRAAQKAKEKEEARQEAEVEKERLEARKDALQREKDRRRAEVEEQKQEDEDEDQRRHDFNQTLKDQKQRLHDIEQEFQQEKQDARN